MTESREEEPEASGPAGSDVESAKPSTPQGGWAGRESGGRKGGLGPGTGPASRRVVARGVRRKRIDDRMLIQALLMVAKELDQDTALEDPEAF